MHRESAHLHLSVASKRDPTSYIPPRTKFHTAVLAHGASTVVVVCVPRVSFFVLMLLTRSSVYLEESSIRLSEDGDPKECMI